MQPDRPSAIGPSAPACPVEGPAILNPPSSKSTRRGAHRVGATTGTDPARSGTTLRAKPDGRRVVRNNEADPRSHIDRIRERFRQDYGPLPFVRIPPERERDPIILGEIDGVPSGGRTANRHGPWLWCSECEGPKFWQGWAITNSTGNLYFIGSFCIREWYGAERAATARASYRARREKDAALDRHRRAMAVAPRVLDEVLGLDLATAMARIDRIRRGWKGAAGDLRTCMLSSLSLNDGHLVTRTPFTDTQGRQQLATTKLGPLAGSALLRDHGHELRLVDAVATATGTMTALDPTTAPAKDVSATVREFEEALDALLAGWKETGAAAAFFGRRNLARVVDFAGHMRRYYAVGMDENGDLRIGDDQATTVIERIPRPELPKLTACLAARRRMIGQRHDAGPLTTKEKDDA